jgi:hypothetical protein
MPQVTASLCKLVKHEARDLFQRPARHRCSKGPSGKAAARSATRRVMSLTFADGRELVSAQCHEPRDVLFARTSQGRSDARTTPVGFFNILSDEGG